MDLGLKNKVAFVAASSQGLGKSVAQELANEGANVIICGRNKETLEQTKQEIAKQANNKVLAIAGDLFVANDRERIIDTVLQSFDSVDILVTNTGGPPAGKFESFKQQDWDNAYQNL